MNRLLLFIILLSWLLLVVMDVPVTATDYDVIIFHVDGHVLQSASVQEATIQGYDFVVPPQALFPVSYIAAMTR